MTDVDVFYSTSYSSIYTDIQEIIHMNMQLAKQLRDIHTQTHSLSQWLSLFTYILIYL